LILNIFLIGSIQPRFGRTDPAIFGLSRETPDTFRKIGRRNRLGFESCRTHPGAQTLITARFADPGLRTPLVAGTAVRALQKFPFGGKGMPIPAPA
jgi:hypothetical protein